MSKQLMRGQTSWRRILATFVAWAVAVRVLRHAYPLFGDGEGLQPTFFLFGIYPSWRDYYQNQSGYDALFSLPYCVAAFLAVVICFIVAPRIAQQPYLHWMTASGLILLGMGASDLASTWHGSGVFFGADLLLNVTHIGVAAFIAAECVWMFRLGLK